MIMDKLQFAAQLKVPTDVVDFLVSKNFVRPNKNGYFDQFHYAAVIRSNAALLAIKKFRKAAAGEVDAARQAAELRSARNLPGRRDAAREEQRRLDEQSRIAELSEQRAKERKQENTASELAAMRQELAALRDELRDALQPQSEQDEV